MIEIIPNWHPFIVHFSIAPLTISTLFFLAILIPQLSGYRKELEVVAKWNLYIGVFSTIIAVASGWQAFTTVAHDAQGHAAMSIHRVWAAVTLILFVSAAAIYHFTQKERIKLWFPIYLVIATCSLMITGYLGAENVYRHGLGVMRVPEHRVSPDQSHTHDEAAHDIGDRHKQVDTPNGHHYEEDHQH